MDEKRHHYSVEVKWEGASGTGTRNYQCYARAHAIMAPGKPVIPGSADPSFRGDAGRWNPEELLVASLSACHKLWYLALCAQSGIVVTAYRDRAHGEMIEERDGAGQFASVVLRPEISLAAGADEARANALHDRAHALCFIARSVNFPVTVEPSFVLEDRA